MKRPYYFSDSISLDVKVIVQYLFKWLMIGLLVGLLVGSASAFFLVSLDFVTNYRIDHNWIIWLLPIGGLCIGLSYHYWGQSVVAGNNQLLDEYHTPQKTIPFKMAPLVLAGTLITHLFGGSAGREGTAVQMGGAIADQFTKLFKLSAKERKTIIIIGISAGFASVFGTPLAGAIFALEVLAIGKLKYDSIIPSFITAYLAHYTCAYLWGVHHTSYTIPTVPDLNHETLWWILMAGIAFGLAALLFAKSVHFWGNLFAKWIHYPPLRPVVGGVILAVFFGTTQLYQYSGLGVPMIVDAFKNPSHSYDFIAKILLTTFTLGAGFKGGEVTPLFFVGATLGSALSLFIPLPFALLAGMGFVAVFSGATNTPIACTLMGIELFGGEVALYMGLACMIAFLFSGHSGIYSAQIIGIPKHPFHQHLKGLRLRDLK
ncbi:MAG: voltage-gated chloride channel family protein [Flavobacteriales bacterium]|nr:voltage-gated chloride channel family protein [Flavobacteriales bacterium]